MSERSVAPESGGDSPALPKDLVDEPPDSAALCRAIAGPEPSSEWDWTEWDWTEWEMIESATPVRCAVAVACPEPSVLSGLLPNWEAGSGEERKSAWSE
jgi:hypothetical protein